MLPLIAAMAAGGAAQGILSSKKTAGSDAGNAFDLGGNYDLARDQILNLLRYQGSDAAIDPLKSSQIATEQVQNNPVLAGLFGKNGSLARAGQEEQNLVSRGYSLQPEDFEAYGQASDNIARQFGQTEQNLAQMLSSRGLSASPMAGQSFSGLMGNKNEQLAQMQRKIADDRMKSNMQRLSDTRNFLSNLGQQGANAIQDQYGRQLASENARFGQEVSKTNAAHQRLAGIAGQSNEQFNQRQETQEVAPWARTIMGGISGGLSGAKAGGIFK